MMPSQKIGTVRVERNRAIQGAKDMRKTNIALRKQVEELERALAGKQAKIDELMFEYCPDEITPEQLAEWEKHQRATAQGAGDL